MHFILPFSVCIYIFSNTVCLKLVNFNPSSNSKAMWVIPARSNITYQSFESLWSIGKKKIQTTQ